MVTKEGVVKVVDFGIARLLDMSMTQPNMMMGSRAYMSPQLYKGERADARADIWAIGVTLYEFLAYQKPFIANNEAELTYRIMHDSPPALDALAEDCPEKLRHIVGRMLEKKTEDRYQTMEDVLHDVQPLWKSTQESTVAGLIADSQQLFAADDLQRAQALLRKALQIDTGNTLAKSLLEKVTADLRRNQVMPKVMEHLEQCRSFLQTGKLREARAEVEAALGLDSKHEPAQALAAEVEAAETRVRDLEQKLRLTKQRLAEGALTEAAAVLRSVFELDRTNPQALELRRQLDEEQSRREKRKKLGDFLLRARTLWTALNYEECLKILSEALKEFPKEPELTKLQEMARSDLQDLRKQVRVGQVRKLLGRQEFTEARKIAEALVTEYPQDFALQNLGTLALEGEQGEQRKKRFADELTLLRGLVAAGKFGPAVTKGEMLLREYPDEFELREVVGYARGEVAQEELRQKERDRESAIRGLLEEEKYGEAEELAQQAVQEFLAQDLFHRLSEEARQKRDDQEQRQRVRQEVQRRIEEINGKIRQDKISDAIELAEQTLKTYGPDPNVTQLLHTASSKRAERKRKEDQDHKIAAAQILIEEGNFAGATQILHEAMATRIFERSDPRLQQQLKKIEHLSSSQKSRQIPEAWPSLNQPLSSESQAAVSGRSLASSATGAREAASAGADKAAMKRPLKLAEAVVRLKRRGLMAGLGTFLIIVLAAVLFPWRVRGPTEKEKTIRHQADQFWRERQFEQSEQAWRQLAQLHGFYEKEASRQISQIEEKREVEKRRFEEGERLLREDKNFTAASQAFEGVIGMNLWLTEDARHELSIARASSNAEDIQSQEKLHFDEGEKLFQTGNYENARKEFQAVADMNVPDSTLRPQAKDYLKKIQQAVEAKKLYDAAVVNIKNENWGEAKVQLQRVMERVGSAHGETKQHLDEVEAVQRAQETFNQWLQEGEYRSAKSQLDGMQQWPKTKDKLRQELQSAQHQRAAGIDSRAKNLQAVGDLNGLEHLQDDVRRFASRAEDPALIQWANNLDKSLLDEEQKLRDKQHDKAAFDAAVAEFNSAKEVRDLNRLNEVLKKFQEIASASGAFRDQAQEYVLRTIPATTQGLNKSIGNGKMIVPPIECAGGQSGPAPSANAQSLSCAQLDANVSLQWVGTPTVEFPSSARQSGKLPYTLHLIVFVDPSGKVKVGKDGNVDSDFFKKAKDASKNWKATIPKSGGKPVSVKFLLAITFER